MSRFYRFVLLSAVSAVLCIGLLWWFSPEIKDVYADALDRLSR